MEKKQNMKREIHRRPEHREMDVLLLNLHHRFQMAIGAVIGKDNGLGGDLLVQLLHALGDRTALRDDRVPAIGEDEQQSVNGLIISGEENKKMFFFQKFFSKKKCFWKIFLFEIFFEF